jgi:hypothetical protein
MGTILSSLVGITPVHKGRHDAGRSQDFVQRFGRDIKKGRNEVNAYLDEVNKAAADFLEDYTLQRTYEYEDITAETIQMSNLIVLRREVHPRYFAGFKNCGRAVFAHDVKLAKTFTSTCPTVEQSMGRLALQGIEVRHEPTIWREGILA